MRYLEYFCHQNRSGYAQAAQDYVFALKDSGRYDIALRLLHASPDKVSMTEKRYAEIVGMTRKVADKDAIKIIHGIPDKQLHIKLSSKTVGFATFEANSPPQRWIETLNKNDAVICPSKFNENVFRHAGVIKPIFHIPHCIDTNLYNYNVSSPKSFDEFTFLFFGTWKARKGYTQLLEAYFKEFDSSDKVRLLIKTDRITIANQTIERIKQDLGLKKDFAPISFETRVLNEEEIPLLIKKADCFVSPTLGEGFGLPGLQSMALGVPIIITNYSGCQDYANSETATLIEPSGMIVLNTLDKIPQFNNQKWAHIKVEDVAKSMRYAFENVDTIKKKAIFAAEFVAKEFSYDATVKRFDNLLETL